MILDLGVQWNYHHFNIALLLPIWLISSQNYQESFVMRLSMRLYAGHVSGYFIVFMEIKADLDMTYHAVIKQEAFLDVARARINCYTDHM